MDAREGSWTAAGFLCPACGYDASAVRRLELPTTEGERAHVWLHCLWCEHDWDVDA
jgi:formate dehydrogenase maturation protein FdhE